jgi:hypothetical protein
MYIFINVDVSIRNLDCLRVHQSFAQRSNKCGVNGLIFELQLRNCVYYELVTAYHCDAGRGWGIVHVIVVHVVQLRVHITCLPPIETSHVCTCRQLVSRRVNQRALGALSTLPEVFYDHARTPTLTLTPATPTEQRVVETGQKRDAHVTVGSRRLVCQSAVSSAAVHHYDRHRVSRTTTAAELLLLLRSGRMKAIEQRRQRPPLSSLPKAVGDSLAGSCRHRTACD